MSGYGIESDSITTTTLISGQRCWFWGLIVETNGTNNATITVEDGSGGSRKMRITVVGADLCYGAILQKPIRMLTGLNAIVAGSGAVAEVLWETWAGKGQE